MKLSVPKGESPVSAGVVPGSQVSGKLVHREVCSEVSQTAVSVLTPFQALGRLDRNYIQRPSGRMRYHMLPKSKSSKEGCTEMVDVAAIGTRIFTLPREVSNYREWFEKSAEVIVVTGNKPR